MRFDELVTFHSHIKRYNPETGLNEISNELSQSILANITDTGTERSKELFGDVDIQTLTVRLKQPVSGSWEYMTRPNIDKRFVRVTTRQPLKADTLIVGEASE